MPPFSKLAAIGADEYWVADAWKEPVPLSGELQRLIRLLPSPARGRDLVSFMNSALELRDRGFRSSSTESARARQLLSDAVNSPASIGITSMDALYKAPSPPYHAAINLAVKAIGPASGDISATHVKLQAAAEVPHDLRVNLEALVDRGGSYILIGAGVIGASKILSGLFKK